jgi:hypothetical protein
MPSNLTPTWQQGSEGFIYGGIATGLIRTLQFPAVRSHLYTMNIESLGNRRVNGVFDLYRRIIDEQGIDVLYRGLPRHLSLTIPRAGCQFGLFEALRASSSASSLTSLCVCGGVSGFLASLLCYPRDSYNSWYAESMSRLGGRDAVSHFEKTATFRHFVKTFPNEVFEKSLLPASANGFARAINLGFYFSYRKEWGSWLSMPCNLALAWTSNAIGGLSIYWIETVHRRSLRNSRSTRTSPDSPPLPTSFRTLLSEIVEKEGVRSLFRGANQNFTRGVTPMLILVFYDYLASNFPLFRDTK